MENPKCSFTELLNLMESSEDTTIHPTQKKDTGCLQNSDKTKTVIRELGIVQGKASFKMKQDYKMTEEEFLSL